MKDIFYISFTRRDFSGPIMPAVQLQAERMTWSAFGGPDQAFLSARGTAQNLFELASLLRCGVQVADPYSTPVWWGYVDEVVIFLESVQVKVSLENLFNQVKVLYSFVSPDNKLADQLETEPAINPQSQLAFGIKETVLHRTDLDEDFAESLRDTFLSLYAWPTSELSQREEPGRVYAELHCSGWFKTLAWQSYQNQDGFYANYGPGPGVFAFGDSINHRYAGQSFTPGVNGDLKYAYFRIRKEGSPTTNLTARLHQDSGGTPQAVLATSGVVSASTVDDDQYRWIKFTWSTPYTLTGGQKYWITLNPGGVNVVNYYLLKIDENMTFVGHGGKYYDQSASTWYKLPSMTAPGSRPDVYFRAVCISDTGDQLAAVAGAGDQFFTKVTSLTTGVQACPYRMNGFDCLEEIQALLNLGTVNQRLVLARVTPERHLEFYEQPDPDEVDLYMDGHSRFFTRECAPLECYLPPIGRWVRLAAVTDIRMPWDKNRLPACFIAGAEYFPQSGRVVIKSM